MNLIQLQYFAAVVEEGSISAAARRLHLSQPPLSIQIRNLEDEYGVKLLERGARRSRVTPAGEVLYEYAVRILEMTHAAEDDLESLKAGQQTSLRLGIISSGECPELLQGLADFRRQYPDISFRIFDRNTYELQQDIEKQRIDLAVIRTPFQTGSIESVTLRDGCQIMHDELGIETPVSDLYEEVCAIVRHHYATDILIMPGAREFLEELSEAGIPMVIATSTPLREVRVALEAHDLSHFFKDIVTTEQVGGRDKVFPDVYLEAARRLGTPVGETWVFEDAPFGVRTSKRAGFNVVGLMNDHDGRDERDVQPWCDIYVHSFAELSLSLIEDYAAVPAAQDAPSDAEPLRVLVVDGSPAPSSPALVARLADRADYVVAADKGAETCRAAGVVPDAYCGDRDSVSAADGAWASSEAGRSISFPSEKYATDLSLAIDCARHEAARQRRPLRLTVTCARTGRGLV